MPIKVRSVLIIFLVFCASTMSPFSSAARDTIRIGGTGSGLELMRRMADLYSPLRKDLDFEVVPSLGTTGGIKALMNRSLDLVIAARPSKRNEKGTESRFLAVTPLVFVAHPDVGQRDVSTAWLERTFSGSIERWADGKRVRLVLRPEGETDTSVVRAISTGMDAAVMSALSRPGMLLAVTDQDSVRMLTRTPGAMGFAALAMLKAERARVRVLTYNGIRPGIEGLRNGSYPLSRSFYLVVREDAGEAVRGFLKFMQTSLARELLKNNQCLLNESK